jgi:hypothetical protein
MRGILSLGFALLSFGCGCFSIGWALRKQVHSPPPSCEAQVAKHKKNCLGLMEAYAYCIYTMENECDELRLRQEGRWTRQPGD